MCETPLILCLDDQVLNVEIRAQLLRLFGCEVVVTSEPQVALHELADRTYDLVLIDYHLAMGIMGDDIARDIRSLYPRLPLVMLTGDAKISDGARACVDIVLIKGASGPAELLQAIRTLLPNKRVKPMREPFQYIPPRAS